ncbi:MAG: beta-agarase, partial [Pseudomonas putida]
MVRLTLPAVFALLFSSPLLAGQQTLFSFVRPASVVNVATEDAGMPQYNAEQTAEGEVLRRVVFNPVERPTLRLSPQGGTWDWSAGQFLTLRLQSAMDWALTVDVTVQGSDGRTLTSRIDLPAGPAQTVMVPLTASSPLSQGMRAGPPMPWSHGGQRVLLTSSAGALDL